jgi:hypothetical protein
MKNSMIHIKASIKGVPYPKNKPRGNKAAPEKWTQAVIEQTSNLPKIMGACLLRLTYCIPRANVPDDCPFGADLDNLNKRFLDALGKTVFVDAPGNDSCVIAMEVTKVIVESVSEAGADFEIIPLNSEQAS